MFWSEKDLAGLSHSKLLPFFCTVINFLLNYSLHHMHMSDSLRKICKSKNGITAFNYLGNPVTVKSTTTTIGIFAKPIASHLLPGPGHGSKSTEVNDHWTTDITWSDTTGTPTILKHLINVQYHFHALCFYHKLYHPAIRCKSGSPSFTILYWHWSIHQTSPRRTGL